MSAHASTHILPSAVPAARPRSAWPRLRWVVGVTVLHALVLALLSTRAPQDQPHPVAELDIVLVSEGAGQAVSAHVATLQPPQHVVAQAMQAALTLPAPEARRDPGPVATAREVHASAQPPMADKAVPPRSVTSVAPPVAGPVPRAQGAAGVAAGGAADVAQATPQVSGQASPEPSSPVQLQVSSVRYAVAPERVYPEVSRRLGEAGQVLLNVLVDENGVPREIEVAHSSGFGRLDRAAVAALRAARFKPYSEGGVAKPFRVATPFAYQLED